MNRKVALARGRLGLNVRNIHITGLNDIKPLLTGNVGCDLVHQYQASFGEVEKTLDLFDSIIAKAS